jgi:hypothetical protein
MPVALPGVVRRSLLLLRSRDPFHDISVTATLHFAAKGWAQILVLRGLTPEEAALVWSL